MNYNDIDEIALEFAKIQYKEQLIFLREASLSRSVELAKTIAHDLDPILLANVAYDRALAFQNEGRKDYVNVHRRSSQKEEEKTT